MPRAASPTEPPPPLGPLLWLAVIALTLAASAVLRSGYTPLRVATAGVGAAVLALRIAAPGVLARPARWLFALLDALGHAVSTALLTAVYLVAVVPYALALRAAGLLAPPDEPWPPDASGWTALDASARRNRAAGSLLAGLAVRAGGAASLVGFLWRRPSFFLVPLVVIVLLLSAVVFLGSATGLGPLIYTMF